MYSDTEIKLTDAIMLAAFPEDGLQRLAVTGVSPLKIYGGARGGGKDNTLLQTKNFEEKMTVERLCKVMKWNINRIPKLANKSYTYKMRKILGQLTQKELKHAAKREDKELKVKRGNAKIKKLMERIS